MDSTKPFCETKYIAYWIMNYFATFEIQIFKLLQRIYFRGITLTFNFLFFWIWGTLKRDAIQIKGKNCACVCVY